MTALRLYTDGSCPAPGAVGGWAWILVSEHPVASTRDRNGDEAMTGASVLVGLRCLLRAPLTVALLTKGRSRTDSYPSPPFVVASRVRGAPLPSR